MTHYYYESNCLRCMYEFKFYDNFSLSYVIFALGQWLNPAPCSWESSQKFWRNQKYSATVKQGNQSIDVFWIEFNISSYFNSVLYSYPKTVEFQYAVEGSGVLSGAMTHLSHWTSNQLNFPPGVPTNPADIAHSDDNSFNITYDIPADTFVPRSYWGNCIKI